MLEADLTKDKQAVSELIAFLDEVYDNYINSKNRSGDPLRAKLARRAFTLIATRNLRRLRRHAGRMRKTTPTESELATLLEKVFVERRVMRTPVPMLPAYPQLAEIATRTGAHILETRAGQEDASVGAVLQICGSDPARLVETYDKPGLRQALSSRHRDMLGLDGLEARDLLEGPGTATGAPRAGSIAYVAAMTLPYRNNGYCSRTEGVALAYQANGCSVDVISKPGFPLNDKSFKSSDIPQTETYEGVRYHRILSPLMTSRMYSEYAAKAADALHEKLKDLRPSHVIAASDYRNSLPALVAARRLGLPFTYEVRGMWELTWASDNPGYENTRQFKVAQELEAFVCRHSDTVLTLTQGMKDSLVARGVEGEKIALMPNGVSPDILEVAPRDTALAERLGFGSDTVVIGYAGAFKEYEGLPDLAAAVAKLATQGLDVVLLIVGAEKADAFGSTPITDEIKKAFDGVGRRERLFMTGRVPFQEMPGYYSIMDICPIARRGYAVSELVSPIKPVEALAQGKAVVLSDVEALKFFAQDETTALLFHKGDVDDLAEKLALFVRDKSLRGDFGQRGRRFVETELRWAHICARAADHIGLRANP